MTETPTAPTPAATYREPPTRGARLAVLAVLALAAGLLVAGLVTVALRASRPAVTSGVLGFRVVDDRHVEVRFEVHKAPLAEAVCVVRARDHGGAEVGRADVTVGPQREDRRVTRVTYLLATTGRAVGGEVPGCRVVRTR